jgi:uncharacterized membrane-anchored protein
MKNIRLISFGLLAVLQLAVPASMITRWESTLRHGDLFKFKTAPVDPYDAFRGRYVALRLDSSTVMLTTNQIPPARGPINAVVATNADGFAYFSEVRVDKPQGQPFIRANVSYVTGDQVTLDLPIDRFYMNELLAPEAEQAYRENSVRTNQITYVLVRVRNGDAVIENLMVGDVSMEDFLQAKQKTE